MEEMDATIGKDVEDNMALPTRHLFRGKLHDKTAYTYTKQLDYKLNTYEERLNKVEEILENDDFFVDYFDDYFKVNINTDEFLSHDNNVCKSLEQMANYLLLAPDENKEFKKNNTVNYKFYTDKALSKKINKETSVDENGKSEAIPFLIDKSRNFRKEAKQEIFHSDYQDADFNTEVKCYTEENPNKFTIKVSNYLGNLNYFSNCCHQTLKNNKKMKYTQQKLLKDTMKDIKTELFYIKDKIKGTIYYKDCLSESEDIHWYLMNFTDQEQVLSLLKVSPRDLLSDLGILVYDLNELINQAGLNEFEEEVIELWRKNDYTQEVIADELKVSQSFISATLKGIAYKIIKQYKENYEDWLYLNYIKGNYKSCSKCGQIKLISKFGKDSRSKDGFYSCCKDCR